MTTIAKSSTIIILQGAREIISGKGLFASTEAAFADHPEATTIEITNKRGGKLTVESEAYKAALAALEAEEAAMSAGPVNPLMPMGPNGNELVDDLRQGDPVNPNNEPEEGLHQGPNDPVVVVDVTEFKEVPADSVQPPKPADVVEAVAKPLSKKAQVYALMQAATGVMIDDIATQLGIGRTAAAALVGDLRRDGKAFTASRKEGSKAVVYKA